MTSPLTDAPRPWYRQFWPWFVISLPASAVVAGLTTVWIAVENHQDLVQDSWYKDGVAINQHLDRQKRAAALGVTLDLDLDPVAGRISGQLGGRLEGFPPLLTLELRHATLPDRDASVTLARMPDGQYAGLTPGLREGRYSVQLTAPASDWQLDGQLTLRGARASLRLGQG